MAEEKLTIDWEDLKGRRVDNRLREQSAMERNRAYSQMPEELLPNPAASPTSIWNNAIFMLVLFGLIGGFLAWGAAQLITGPLTPYVGTLLHYQPDARAVAAARVADIEALHAKAATKQIEESEALVAEESIRVDSKDNPYFAIAIDSHLAPKQRAARIADQESSDGFAVFVINTLSYGVCGMMIALCLAIAEPVSQHKSRAAVINGSAGAVVGLIGGAAAALLFTRISTFTGSVTQGQVDWIKQISDQSAVWGVLGLFLGMGSGLVLLNFKKTVVGLFGGLLGGIIGGALLFVMETQAHNPEVGKLVALIAIGVVAGLTTGLLENAVKAGWLKVTTGIIAGKQFILYRNPTYIGSSPDCQIYLFKDPKVGRRHAAIHLLPGGIEIEDLPLGGATLINGKPVARARLKSGDTIQIGATSFRFQEKRPSAGK